MLLSGTAEKNAPMSTLNGSPLCRCSFGMYRVLILSPLDARAKTTVFSRLTAVTSTPRSKPVAPSGSGRENRLVAQCRAQVLGQQPELGLVQEAEAVEIRRRGRGQHGAGQGKQGEGATHGGNLLGQDSDGVRVYKPRPAAGHNRRSED